MLPRLLIRPYGRETVDHGFTSPSERPTGRLRPASMESKPERNGIEERTSADLPDDRRACRRRPLPFLTAVTRVTCLRCDAGHTPGSESVTIMWVSESETAFRSRPPNPGGHTMPIHSDTQVRRLQSHGP